MKRRTFIFKAPLAGAACAGLSAPALATGVRRWRLLSFWPEAHPVTAYLSRYASTLEAATDGQLQIEIIQSTGIPAPKILGLVGSGEYQLGHAVPYLWTDTIPAASLLFTYPFGPTRREKNAWLTHGGGQDLVNRIYNDAGCAFFPLGGSGPQMGGWFRAPLESLADLDGLRIRIGGLGASVMKAAGAKPQSIPIFGGKIQAALKSGEIDAAEVQTPSADMRNGFHKLAGTYHYPNWHEPSPTFDLFINSSEWTALSESTRETVRLVTRSIDEEMRAITVIGNAKAFAALSEMPSVEITRFPSDVMSRLSELAPEVVTEETKTDPRSAELYASLSGFLEKTAPWSQVTDGAYLAMRG